MTNTPLPVPLPDVTILTCSCCGAGVADTPEANVDHATRGCDTGYGICRECGGEDQPAPKPASEMTEAEFKRRQGWAMVTFMTARIPIVHASLSPENQAKWAATPYWKQCAIIQRFIEKGLMI